MKMTKIPELKKLRICANCRHFDDVCYCDRLKSYEIYTEWNYTCNNFKGYGTSYSKRQMAKKFPNVETWNEPVYNCNTGKLKNEKGYI